MSGNTSEPPQGLNYTAVLKLFDPAERLPALSLLIAFSLIGIAAASGAPGWLIAGGAIVGALLLLVSAVLNPLQRNRRLQATAEEVRSASDAATRAGTEPIDTFFAAPMAAAKDYDTADDVGPHLLMILEALREDAGADRIYYGGKLIAEQKNFDHESDGYFASNSALSSAERFVLIWPRSLATSALFELGVAKARRLPTVIFFKKEADLPYLLRGRLQLTPGGDWPVKFVRFETIRDIVDTVRVQGAQLFPAPQAAAGD